MIVGASVLPAVTVDIADASTTRNPPMRRTRSRELTTTIGSSPNLQMATGRAG
jgi:hypothetical protein